MPTRKKSAPKQRRQHAAHPSPWDDLRATGRTAGRALAVFKGAASLLNAEIKSVDTILNTAVSSTGVVTFVSGIAQGDGNSSRDGNSVKLKGASFRYYHNVNASSTRTFVRTMVVVDTRGAGANPSISDIITSLFVVAHPNLVSEPNRYVIVHDETTCLSPAAAPSMVRNVALPAFADMHLVYAGTTAAVASATGPSVFVVNLSSEATNTPTMYGEFRMLYVDN